MSPHRPPMMSADIFRPAIPGTCVREQVYPERSRPVAARAAGRGWGHPAGDGRGNGPLDRNYQILAFPLGCRPDRSAPIALRPGLGAERGDQGMSSTWEHAVRPRGPRELSLQAMQVGTGVAGAGRSRPSWWPRRGTVRALRIRPLLGGPAVPPSRPRDQVVLPLARRYRALAWQNHVRKHRSACSCAPTVTQRWKPASRASKLPDGLPGVDSNRKNWSFSQSCCVTSPGNGSGEIAPTPVIGRRRDAPQRHENWASSAVPARQSRSARALQHRQCLRLDLAHALAGARPRDRCPRGSSGPCRRGRRARSPHALAPSEQVEHLLEISVAHTVGHDLEQAVGGGVLDEVPERGIALLAASRASSDTGSWPSFRISSTFLAGISTSSAISSDEARGCASGSARAWLAPRGSCARPYARGDRIVRAGRRAPGDRLADPAHVA